MNNKILKDLIKELISKCNDKIKEVDDKEKKELKERVNMYNHLLKKLSKMNNEYIDEVDVLDSVFNNSDFNYYIKKDILEDIMNYNRELYLKKI